MSTGSHGRRRFLAGLGGLAGASLLARPRLARADAPIPKRLLVFTHQHGFVYDDLAYRPPGATETTDFDAPLAGVADESLPPLLRSIAAYRNRMTVVDGLALVTAQADPSTQLNEHLIGSAHLLTGRRVLPVRSGPRGGGISVDQVIAARLAGPARIPSLEFAVLEEGYGGVNYLDRALSAPTATDPASSLDRLFVPAPGSRPPAEEAARAAQSPLFRFLSRRYERAATFMTGADRDKLHFHRDLLTAAATRAEVVSTLACRRPDLDGPFGDGSTAESYDAQVDAFIAIVTAALACDLTRVVTLQLGQLRNGHVGITGDVHADYAHSVEAKPEAKAVMSRYGLVHTGHLLKLLAALDAVPEGDGTLLDHTLVLWCSEVATGNHRYGTWPAILFGGGGGSFRMGRYLREVERTPSPRANPPPAGFPAMGRPHNTLLTTLARGFGESVDSFGDLSVTTPRGERIDTSGVVPGLLT